MKEKITVMGVGRLGLSFALLANSKGYDVCGCDVNEDYVESLISNSFKSKEPKINELLKSSTVTFTIDREDALSFSDMIFVFVPTPSLENGAYNHKYVDQVVSKIIQYRVKDVTLVIGCTVMPKYCNSIQKMLADQNINVVYNPEFIAQGSIIDGLENADMVLIGGDEVPDKLTELYKNIMTKEPVFNILTTTGAEITKISINCFLVLKISFANMIGEIAINSYEEKSVNDILSAIGSDSRIGNKFLSYGFPAGGVCLPRDGRALNNHAYSVRVYTHLMKQIDVENKRHYDYLKEYYMAENPNKEVPFLFSSLSYKKGVDILTESFQLNLCIDLLRLGYSVDVPLSTKSLDVPEEFKDYVYKGAVTFETQKEGYRIN